MEFIVLVSEVTRRNIFDIIRIQGMPWSGRLGEQEFLSRIFDFTQIRSSDSRHADIAGDIWRHREFNDDWPDDWVFTDDRFDLLQGDDEVFLRFLCEMLHPAARPTAAEVEPLRREFNAQLAADGYELTEKTRLSSRPVYAARHLLADAAPVVASLRRTTIVADADYVVAQITRMEAAVESDPGLAIGTAKELVETCCKTILHERDIELSGAPELPALVKQTVKALSLVPDDIPDGARAADVIKRLLSNLATITHGIAELRNHYGTGHGRVASTRGLQPRHAKLAVGAASTLALFLLETHQQRQAPEPRPSSN